MTPSPNNAPHHRRGERDWPIVAPEGLPIVGIFVLVSLAISVPLFLFVAPLAGMLAGVVCGVLTLWCVWFFRDPVRNVPTDANAVVCPADGVVCAIDNQPPPPELGLTPEQARGMVRVCVFMNVFNVHVNRAPVAGDVALVHYRPGKFFNASLDKASEHNERQSLVLRMPDGRMVVAVQIAGLVARRIVCRVKEGTSLLAGERYGLIRFGSRVDVYAPQGSTPLVTLGQKTVAGETILARLSPAPTSPTRSAGPAEQVANRA